MTAIHNGTALLKQEDLNSEALIVILCFPPHIKTLPTILYRSQNYFPRYMFFALNAILPLQIL